MPRGSRRYPEVLYKLISVDLHLRRPHRTICGIAQKLYANFPAASVVNSWGIDLTADKVSGRKLNCQVGIKQIQARIRHFQLAGYSSRARREIKRLVKLTTGQSKFPTDMILAQFLVTEGYLNRALTLYLPAF